MSDQSEKDRILIVDDQKELCILFAKSLQLSSSRFAEAARLEALKARLAGKAAPPQQVSPRSYDIDMAHQGQDACAMIRKSLEDKRPYSLVFLDMRMPPGWDGLETMVHIWELDPKVQIVICTAYSDYSWEEIVARVGIRDNLLILKKPFDPAEVSQLALSLTEKHRLTKLARIQVEDLQRMIQARTSALEEANEEANDLLDNTLKGLVRALTELLEMMTPAAFSYANRLSPQVLHLALKLLPEYLWHCEVASMLAHIGCITVPEHVLKQYFNGLPLSDTERSMVDSFPQVSRELLAHIPKLELVAEIIGKLHQPGLMGSPPSPFAGLDAATKAALLIKTAIDYDIRQISCSKDEVLAQFRALPETYPGEAVDALESFEPEISGTRRFIIKKIPLPELKEGMILNEDIISKNGIVIASRSHHVNKILLRRIANYKKEGLIQEDSVSIISPISPGELP